ncbi:hypothetical protein LTR94_026820 [Friedmanniomyces endolithicus]|nr:hypothetical protein LTR94_026820 [Friedmanniomyces endolithicus]
MAQVAMGSGFGSVRRFNETFQALYGRPPSDLRRRRLTADLVEASAGIVRIGLTYRPPYDWSAMMQTLALRRAAQEAVAGSTWSRRLSLEIDGAEGEVAVKPGAAGRAMAEVRLSDLKALPGVLARVRHVFDLAADPDAIARDLSADPELAAMIRARPGLRPAGDWLALGEAGSSDRFETLEPGLAQRAEQWRPWRAYGRLYWNMIEERRNILLVTDTGGAVRALDFADFEHRMLRLLRLHYGTVDLSPAAAPLAVRQALEAFFGGDLEELGAIPVETGGTEFQRAVWRALRDIPAGQTRSYGQIAQSIASPKAVRAVGLANGSNPVGVIVPCHRVIGKSGALTGYAGGVERKRWLLAHEAGRRLL